MLGYKLFTSGRNLGTLDLYSSTPNAFDAEAEVVGELFAAHAAIALPVPPSRPNFADALTSRDTIGMAKGILMQRERLTDEQAFNLLVSTSQKANIKLHDLAAWLVDNVNNAASQPSKPSHWRPLGSAGPLSAIIGQ